MHPIGVASAAWVFAAAPSKVPFYVAGGLLAAWAVLLAAFGVTHEHFPSSMGRQWLVIGVSVVLVGGAISMAVVTAGEESSTEAQATAAPAPAPASGSQGAGSTFILAADITGNLAYDKRSATVASGRVTVRFVNRSPVPHNVTIAKDGKVVARTKTLHDGTATTTAELQPGQYVYYCSVDAHRQAGMQGTLTVR